MLRLAQMHQNAVPQVIISSRDIRFGLHSWVQLFEELQSQTVYVHVTSPLHPQSDGPTETMNRIFEDTLRHFVDLMGTTVLSSFLW